METCITKFLKTFASLFLAVVPGTSTTIPKEEKTQYVKHDTKSSYFTSHSNVSPKLGI